MFSDTAQEELPDGVVFREKIVLGDGRQDALVAGCPDCLAGCFVLNGIPFMNLAVNQPCFIETTGRDILIAQARVVQLSENGGSLLCESGELVSPEIQPAVLVAITGHRLRRIAIMITRQDSDLSTVTFSRG